MKAYTLIIILIVLFVSKAIPAGKDIIETTRQQQQHHTEQLLAAMGE